MDRSSDIQARVASSVAITSAGVSIELREHDSYPDQAIARQRDGSKFDPQPTIHGMFVHPLQRSRNIAHIPARCAAPIKGRLSGSPAAHSFPARNNTQGTPIKPLGIVNNTVEIDPHN
jgi:hypothetical protein